MRSDTRHHTGYRPPVTWSSRRWVATAMPSWPFSGHCHDRRYDSTASTRRWPLSLVDSPSLAKMLPMCLQGAARRSGSVAWPRTSREWALHEPHCYELLFRPPPSG